MNTLVKIIRDDNGWETEHPVWHLVDPRGEQGDMVLCTGEFFGHGESLTVEFETKKVQRGGVECARCAEIVKIYKAVKL